MIAVVANEKGLPVFHPHVSQTAGLAPLGEGTSIRLPPGCSELFDKVVNLRKCQYGFEQAGRKEHLLQVTWLLEKIEIEQCNVKPCVFRKVVENEVSPMVGIHVDGIVESEEQGMCDEFFEQLKQCFPVKNLGKINMHTG